MAPDPQRASRAFGSSQVDSCPPPPQIFGPVRPCWQVIVSKNTLTQIASLTLLSSIVTVLILKSTPEIKAGQLYIQIQHLQGQE